MGGIACASSNKVEIDLSETPQFIDISVNDIFLQDSRSTEKVLGGNIIVITEQDLPSASVRVSNKNRSEVLILTFHPGDIKNSCSEFTVTAADTQEAITLSGAAHFITGKGIKLGISKSDVMRILGEAYALEAHENGLTIKYRLEGIESSAFLKRYNMPIYYGRYKFINDSLIEFSFGFEYP